MIYPNHKYYTILEKYYKNGNIKEKGLKFGGVNIGIWECYNEDGKLVKTINEDEKFNPNFSYNDIINYLHQIGKIDKYCKKKKQKLKASFNKNEWFVRVFFETKKMGYTGRYEDKQHEYEFDYNGNILNKNENVRFIKGGHIE